MNKIMFKINDVMGKLCLMFMFGIAEIKILNCNKTLAIVLGFILVFVNVYVIRIIVQITKRISQKFVCYLFKIDNY